MNKPCLIFTPRPTAPHCWCLLYSLCPALPSFTKPDGIEGGNATAPIFEGVGDVEVEDGVVAAVPRYEEDRSTVTAQELSSDEHLLKEQESVLAAHDSVTTQDGDAGARQDSGTHGARR